MIIELESIFNTDGSSYEFDYELSLSHIDKFEKEIADAGIATEMVSPKLLPDYTRKG